MIPTTGQRHTQKIFGAIDLYDTRFFYHQDSVFNSQTYVHFLERLAASYEPRTVYLVHDNAAYHKAPEVRQWLHERGHHFHLCPLPPYSPEFNAVERIWHHVRLKATHNRYFGTEQELKETLHSTFRSIQRSPEQITGYLQPFL